MKWKLLESATKFNFNNRLNPVLWDKDNKLRAEVKVKILEFVEEFCNTLDIPLNILDIEIVGSNASYNYTKKSDVDVHIITNFESYGYPIELVQAAMQAFKANFNKAYDVSYKGYNVEIYVEDVKSSPTSNGIYSVMRDEWIKFPSMLTPIEVELEPYLSSYKNRIQKVLKSGTAHEINSIIDELYILRRTSLLQDGEFGAGNLIFKEIRNLGLLDELKDKKVEHRSKELSMESVNK